MRTYSNEQENYDREKSKRKPDLVDKVNRDLAKPQVTLIKKSIAEDPSQMED